MHTCYSNGACVWTESNQKREETISLPLAVNAELQDDVRESYDIERQENLPWTLVKYFLNLTPERGIDQPSYRICTAFSGSSLSMIYSCNTAPSYTRILLV